MIVRIDTSPFHSLFSDRMKERNMLFIITLAIVKKPYLVDAGLIVKKSEDRMTARKIRDMADKGDRHILIEPFLIACHINDNIRMFVEINISVNAR